MEGLRQQFGAKFGPLPVWAWALLAVLAVVGWMYFTKSGFFGNQAGTDATGPTDSGGDSGAAGNALPVGLGGLAGGGNPGDTTSGVAAPLPSYYDPSSGGFAGLGSSSGDTGSQPNAVFTSAPLNNYSAPYASTVLPSGPSSGGYVGGGRFGTVIGNAISGAFGSTPFNPVVPRSSGTQAV